MELYGVALGLGMLSGVAGTGLGVLFSIFVRRVSRAFMGGCILVSGGVMIAVVCFDLLPEALGPGDTGSCFAGIFLGMGLVAGLDALLKARRRGGDAHLGALMAAGIVAHNLPEGLAIGAGLSRSLAFGAGLCLLIALHDLPEGLALGLPLRRAGMRSLRLLGLVLLLGLPSGLGTLAGAALSVQPALMSLSFGMASGAILYIACGELIPSSFSATKERPSGLWLVTGFLAGLLACLFL